MNRLQSELHRLFLPIDDAAAHSGTACVDRDHASPDATAGTRGLVDAEPGTRALVLEWVRPIDGEAVTRVWRGVQAELGLPAPAVAINGFDGLQLWFSLDAPVDTRVGLAFLQAVRQRFLASLPAARPRMLTHVAPSADPTTPPDVIPQTAVLPGAQPVGGQWSAFIAPDLASLFLDTPWLDLSPNPEGQADLLVPLRSIDHKTLSAAMTTLGMQPDRGPAAASSDADTPPAQSSETVLTDGERPEDFLLRVMRDETAPLALRVEAAKALLAHAAVTTHSIAAPPCGVRVHSG